MTIEEILRLGILFDADKGGTGAGGSTDDDPNPTDDNPTDDKDDKSDSKGANGGGSNDKPTGTEPGDKSDGEPKTFTQEDLDRIIADRLARERKKQEEKAEQERLKEEGKYKELAEKLQAQIEEKEQELLTSKKAGMLKDVGYSKEQADMLVNMLQGDTDEELTESLEEIKKTFPAKSKKYYDPGLGNGTKNKPESVDGAEIGRSMFETLLKNGRIRGFKKD